MDMCDVPAPARSPAAHSLLVPLEGSDQGLEGYVRAAGDDIIRGAQEPARSPLRQARLPELCVM